MSYFPTIPMALILRFVSVVGNPVTNACVILFNWMVISCVSGAILCAYFGREVRIIIYKRHTVMSVRIQRGACQALVVWGLKSTREKSNFICRETHHLARSHILPAFNFI